MKKPKEKTRSEKLLGELSKLHYYKELVFEDLRFTPKGGTEIELADLIIYGGDFIIAIQLKERNQEEQKHDIDKQYKWLLNKCKVAKKQVKDSINIIKSGNSPSIKNGRGQEIVLNPNAEIIPLVIFENALIQSDYPHVLLKHSTDGMDINCMSFSDYKEMCNWLVSPIEISEYLKWRLAYYQKNGNIDFSIIQDDKDNITIIKPTKSETLCYQFIVENYGTHIDLSDQEYKHYFSFMLSLIPERVVPEALVESSYTIILFLAHFDRLEIKSFVDYLRDSLEAAAQKRYGIIRSLRNLKQRYVIAFVSSYDGYAYDMDWLDEISRRGGDFDNLLQVFVYWINDQAYRIDYIFRDKAKRYLI